MGGARRGGGGGGLVRWDFGGAVSHLRKGKKEEGEEEEKERLRDKKSEQAIIPLLHSSSSFFPPPPPPPLFVFSPGKRRKDPTGQLVILGNKCVFLHLFPLTQERAKLKRSIGSGVANSAAFQDLASMSACLCAEKLNT